MGTRLIIVNKLTLCHLKACLFSINNLNVRLNWTSVRSLKPLALNISFSTCTCLVYWLLIYLISDTSPATHHLNTALKCLRAHDLKLIAACGHKYLDVLSVTQCKVQPVLSQELGVLFYFHFVSQVFFGFTYGVEPLLNCSLFSNFPLNKVVFIFSCCNNLGNTLSNWVESGLSS